MKLNFRKIASVLSSAVMVSSTVALAAAASFPAPFVNNGNADVAVVWGSTAQLDSAAVTDLVASLNDEITPGSTSVSTVTGESFTLQKDRNKFNLNNDLNDIYSSLDLDELPTLLADGTYEAEDESDYTQEITLGAGTLDHFQNDDFNDEKPLIGFEFENGEPILNYTLEMDSAVTIEADSDIVIMGRKYYIADNSSADNSITLLDASASQRINEGDTLTVEATNGKTYTVKLDYVEEESSDSDEADANFIINDESIDSMEPGDTEEIEEGVYIVVDKVDYVDSDRRTSYAQFSLGTGKLLLTDGEEVELNDDPISSIEGYEQHMLIANLTTVSGNLKSIRLDWEAEDDLWLAPGTDLVMPGFGAVKLSMGEFQTGDYEKTTLEGSGDALYLKTETVDGEVSVPLFYHSSGTVAGLGKDSNEILITNATGSGIRTLVLNATLDPTFVTTWISNDEAESHVFKLKKFVNNTDDEPEITLDNLASGADDKVITGLDESVEVGEIKITMTGANEATDMVTITVEPSGTAGNYVFTDKIVTKSGLLMNLPVLVPTNYASSIRAPYVNASNLGSVESDWVAIFEEEDKDDTISSGGRFNISISADSSDGFEPNTVAQGPTLIETEEDSDLWVAYVESELATKIEMDKPTSGVNSITISYPDSESYAEVMVAESGAVVSGGSTGNLVPIRDTDTIPTDKNLIVVGGSCVNTLAAQLLGLPANSCGSAWQTKTGVGTGQFLIQTFARDGGNVATLVAGYDAADTQNAVNALQTDTKVDVSTGKKFVGTGTSVQAVTVA